MKRQVEKTKLPRNWHAVNAWNRKSAGSMVDKKKQQSKYECRKWKP
jgi:hypothetical protein